MSYPRRTNWELGGLYSEAGQLDRPVASGRLVVPNDIEVERERLWWGFDLERPIDEHEPGPGLLIDFVALHTADDRQIGVYARRWGVLCICRHRLPTSHAYDVGGFRGRCPPLGYTTTDRFVGWDPLERWRHFSRQVAAMLSLSASLHTDEPGKPDDWQVILQRADRRVPWWKPDVEAERLMLAIIVTEWMALGDVRPALTWRDGPGPQVAFGSGAGESLSLFAALACQLLFATARVDSVAVCSGCGGFFSPTRRPREGQRRYCPVCTRDGVPQRHAQRDRQRRRRTDRATQPSG